MLHFYYVGYFDPRDPVDVSVRPLKPKVQRPLPRHAVDSAFAAFTRGVGEFVSYEDEGYVICGWSLAPKRLWDSIHRFALRLAQANGAVVMNEPPGWLIEFPEEARRIQAECLAS